MFPFDAQSCQGKSEMKIKWNINIIKKAIFLNFAKIVIESYAYRLYALKLEWKQPEPIQYSDKLALASFSLAGNLFKETCQRNYLTGNFRKALFFYYLAVFDENILFFLNTVV